jgi:hypothetical protein
MPVSADNCWPAVIACLFSGACAALIIPGMVVYSRAMAYLGIHSTITKFS